MVEDGCSRPVAGEEGKFICMHCSDETFVEDPAKPSTTRKSTSQQNTSKQSMSRKTRSPDCPNCGKSFAQNANLKRHLLKVHGVKC